VLRVLVLLLVATSVVHAGPANDIIARPLVLEPGQWHAELVTEINLSEGAITKPTSFAPDVWYGIAPRLTVGLIHSDPSVDRIAPGASFCVRAQLLDCDHFYRGSGIEVLWSALEGPLAVAPRARVLLRDIDPALPAMTLGAALRWTRGRFAISGDPYLRVGLANTDRGNRSALVLPVVFAVQPTCGLALELATGWNSDLAVVTDGWHVPVGLGGRVRITHQLELSSQFGFTSLLGPQNTPKERVLFFAIGWRS
jgi:hypothetical protein